MFIVFCMYILYLAYDSVPFSITEKGSEFKEYFEKHYLLSLNFKVIINIICEILFNYFNILDLKKIFEMLFHFRYLEVSL